MKLATLLSLCIVPFAAGFSVTSSFSGLRVAGAQDNAGALTMEYIPSGMSKAQWQKMKEQERNKNKGKNLGKVGITSFKSRSFADWQKSGGKNLFPVDPRSVKSAKEIPYMQRAGGSADDSDLGGGMLGGLFKKKSQASEPEQEEPKTNWWTL